jgi:hypothetical protein
MFNPDQHHIEYKLPKGHNDDDWVAILDNGATSFVVYISPDKTIVSIYKIPSDAYVWDEDWDYEDNNKIRGFYQELIIRLDIERIWIYKEEEKEAWDRGNSILIMRKDGTYVFIGWEIYSFRTEEPIEEYMSKVGNSSVSYPVALSSTKAYFMTAHKWLSLDNIKDKENPNETYYRSDRYGLLKAHNFSVDIICKRQ